MYCLKISQKMFPNVSEIHEVNTENEQFETMELRGTNLEMGG